MKILYYSDFGAVGDGVTDDMEAIVRTHEAANKAGVGVCADSNAVYYIGGANRTAIIQTPTDWRGAKFIIDDTEVEDSGNILFKVMSKQAPVEISAIQSFKKNQGQLDIRLPYDALMYAVNKNVVLYKREGLNVNQGEAQSDVFILRKDGLIDGDCAPVWDFDEVSALTAYPIDDEVLTIRGGFFTTLANRAKNEYRYFFRGITVMRSRVVFDGIIHTVEKESDHGSPYNGFITFNRCTDCVVQNAEFTAHRTYTTIGSAGLPVQMGSYDLLANYSVNLLYKNCRQLNDICDTRFWGIFSSNGCKNITMDGVVFSRFDAHKGTVNPVIKNSTIGHMGIKLIGSGTCLLENTKVLGSHFVEFRPDYGSTWDVEIIIRNCEYTPLNLAQRGTLLFHTWYSGQHDFGYPCFMPRKITIDGLVIHDESPPEGYSGPYIFNNLHPNYDDASYVATYPYTLIKALEIKRLTAKSGKPWVLSKNKDLFKDLCLIEAE